MICTKCNEKGIENSANGQYFWYCRTCKDEIREEPDTSEFPSYPSPQEYLWQQMAQKLSQELSQERSQQPQSMQQQYTQQQQYWGQYMLQQPMKEWALQQTQQLLQYIVGTSGWSDKVTGNRTCENLITYTYSAPIPSNDFKESIVSETGVNDSELPEASQQKILEKCTYIHGPFAGPNGFKYKRYVRYNNVFIGNQYSMDYKHWVNSEKLNIMLDLLAASEK